jgi:hypothetical protein
VEDHEVNLREVFSMARIAMVRTCQFVKCHVNHEISDETNGSLAEVEKENLRAADENFVSVVK